MLCNSIKILLPSQDIHIMIGSFYAQQRLQRSLLPNIYRVSLTHSAAAAADDESRCDLSVCAAIGQWSQHTHTHTRNDRVRYIWILRSLVRNSSGTAIGAPHPRPTHNMLPHAASIGRDQWSRGRGVGALYSFRSHTLAKTVGCKRSAIQNSNQSYWKFFKKKKNK